MVWHFRFGYVVISLLAFRLVWGLVGGRWSRFSSFIYAPGTVLRYLRGRSRAGEHQVGHSPLGSLSVFALLVILALQVGTGLVADDEIANVGPLQPLCQRRSLPARPRTGTRTTASGSCWRWWLLHLLARCCTTWWCARRRPGPADDRRRQSLLPAHVPSATDSLRRARCWRWLRWWRGCAPAGWAGLASMRSRA